jgi:uncharacterized protein
MIGPLPDLRDRSLSAAAVRDALALQAHPEGGCYRELWRDQPESGGRGAASTILFLLGAGERSHWHRVDAAEIWIWQAGAPLQLGIADAIRSRQIRLGPNLAHDETLQMVVPAHAWQEARSLGAWTLVACVVAPAFDFSGFELAPANWRPGAS